MLLNTTALEGASNLSAALKSVPHSLFATKVFVSRCASVVDDVLGGIRFAKCDEISFERARQCVRGTIIVNTAQLLELSVRNHCFAHNRGAVSHRRWSQDHTQFGRVPCLEEAFPEIPSSLRQETQPQIVCAACLRSSTPLGRRWAGSSGITWHASTVSAA